MEIFASKLGKKTHSNEQGGRGHWTVSYFGLQIFISKFSFKNLIKS